MRDIIRRPVFTEKSVQLLEKNQYTFEVDSKATKPEIKSFLESAFQVKVLSVNTHILPKKRASLLGRAVPRPRQKRAIVTLSWGDRIVFFLES
uniref:Large ribosomal subunit protein uL23c n=1 Tax=Streptosarcina moshanensis TaxID=3096259 RepID=A0AAU0UDV2_9VIRI|nr:ribosomal protein L23 [Streptosarcina arenaria]WKT08873.1 ribosomal protein L23 [Streptosarcina arenaria]